jgi:hypothetical protein
MITYHYSVWMNKEPYVGCFCNADEALLFAEKVYNENQGSRYVIYEHTYHSDYEPMPMSGRTIVSVFFNRGR